jgi:metal-sulfur cluster biosynthetic enzyme
MEKIKEEVVFAALKNVYDPEIPVNIVDLGLVYDVRVTDENVVTVKMTLTARGCGMGTFIAADAKNKLMSIPEVTDANVELVWDPPWTPQMVSEEAKRKLGIPT